MPIIGFNEAKTLIKTPVFMHAAVSPGLVFG